MALVSCLLLLILLIGISSVCAADETVRFKRLLLDDEYDTIVSRLNNLTKEVEALKAENVVLHQKQFGKGVAFHATLSSSISGGQKQVIIFDHVELNLGNAYNVHHGNFIAPVNGTYLFSMYVCSHTSHTIVLDLIKNGISVGRLLAGDADYSNCNSNTFLLELKHGDDVYVTEGTYGDLVYVTSNYGKPKFTGVLINAY